MQYNPIVKIDEIDFTLKDISQVVHEFYRRVQHDRHLKHPFNTIDDWPQHIEKLTHFWWIRFGGTPYMDTMYDPVQKHFETGFSQELLDIWIDLFHTTAYSILSKEQADIWMRFVTNIGRALNHNNELMKMRYQSR